MDGGENETLKVMRNKPTRNTMPPKSKQASKKRVTTQAKADAAALEAAQDEVEEEPEPKKARVKGGKVCAPRIRASDTWAPCVVVARPLAGRCNGPLYSRRATLRLGTGGSLQKVRCACVGGLGRPLGGRRFESCVCVHSRSLKADADRGCFVLFKGVWNVTDAAVQHVFPWLKDAAVVAARRSGVEKQNELVRSIKGALAGPWAGAPIEERPEAWVRGEPEEGTAQAAWLAKAKALKLAPVSAIIAVSCMCACVSAHNSPMPVFCCAYVCRTSRKLPRSPRQGGRRLTTADFER